MSQTKIPRYLPVTKSFTVNRFGQVVRKVYDTQNGWKIITIAIGGLK